MLANDFIENVKNENYYVFAGKTLQYETGDANTIPVPDNSDVQLEFTIPNNMILGKYVSDSDVSLMIKNRLWVANTVYFAYDDEEQSLDTKDFYVVSKEGEEYGVFKCINNYNNSPSTVQPVISETSASDEFYQTSDNYVWKFMYKVPTATFDKFATDDHFPFLVDSEVVNNAIAGTIDYIELTDTGLGYNQTADGVIIQTNIAGNNRKFYVQGNDLLNPTTDFYINNAFYIDSGTGAGQLRKIVGFGIEGNFKYVLVDEAFTTTPVAGATFIISPNVVVNGNGSGFRARAIVDTETTSLDSIEIIERGSNYLYGDVVIETNEAYAPVEYSQGQGRAIVLPKDGHGSNPQKELFARNVGFSISFVGDEVPSGNNDFRVLGILKNPSLRNVTLDIDSVSGLSVGDDVTQTATGAVGKISAIDSPNSKIQLEESSGVFLDSEDIEVGNTSFTISNIEKNNDLFDQTLRLSVTYIFQSAFENDEKIVQSETNAEGYIFSSANNVLNVVDTKGTFSANGVVVGQSSGTRATINSVTQPDMIVGSEDILYVQNVNPITRTSDTTERLKIIIGF